MRSFTFYSFDMCKLIYCKIYLLLCFVAVAERTNSYNTAKEKQKDPKKKHNTYLLTLTIYLSITNIYKR